MSMRASLERVLSEYLSAKQQPFAQHQLAAFIRRELTDAAAAAAGHPPHLKFKGSAGQGTWADGPWVGAFNPLVSTGAQKGIYPVFLFREDMGGVYLSLNQGVTEVREHYKSDAATALRARAANYRAKLGSVNPLFPITDIDLASTGKSSYTALYEAGNIYAKAYWHDHAGLTLPSDDELTADLLAMVSLYDELVDIEMGATDNLTSEGDEPAVIGYEDASRWRTHKRIERNAALVKKVKNVHGYICQVCGLDFQKRYGEVGRGYIEAHHLLPLSTLKGQRVPMDPRRDFAVLCANCHRMVHRSGCVDDIERFKMEHFISSES